MQSFGLFLAFCFLCWEDPCRNCSLVYHAIFHNHLFICPKVVKASDQGIFWCLISSVKKTKKIATPKKTRETALLRLKSNVDALKIIPAWHEWWIQKWFAKSLHWFCTLIVVGSLWFWSSASFTRKKKETYCAKQNSKLEL